MTETQKPDLSTTTPATGVVVPDKPASVPDKPALEGLEAKWSQTWREQGVIFISGPFLCFAHLDSGLPSTPTPSIPKSSDLCGSFLSSRRCFL